MGTGPSSEELCDETAFYFVNNAKQTYKTNDKIEKITLELEATLKFSNVALKYSSKFAKNSGKTMLVTVDDSGKVEMYIVNEGKKEPFNLKFFNGGDLAYCMHAAIYNGGFYSKLCNVQNEYTAAKAKKKQEEEEAMRIVKRIKEEQEQKELERKKKSWFADHYEKLLWDIVNTGTLTIEQYYNTFSQFSYALELNGYWKSVVKIRFDLGSENVKIVYNNVNNDFYTDYLFVWIDVPGYWSNVNVTAKEKEIIKLAEEKVSEYIYERNKDRIKREAEMYREYLRIQGEIYRMKQQKEEEDRKRNELRLLEIEKDDRNTEEFKKPPKCVICMDHKAKCAVVPCGHVCLCSSCSNQGQNINRCPMCRGYVEKIIKTYFV